MFAVFPPSTLQAEERPLTPSFENKWGPCIRLCVVGIVVLLITAIVVITTLYPRKRTLPEALFPGCPTELKVFTATLNYSVDPCEDFRGHVCSGGRKTTEFPQDTPRVLRHAWNSQGARFLEVGRTPRVAAALFDACIVQLSRDVGDLARVLRFFREWGIPWPAPTGGRYHAFDVLLDLVINWGVVVFFELKLNRRPGRTRHSLIINYIDASKPLQQWVSILRQQGAHVHYARTFYEAFGAGSTPTSQLERVLRMESSIMDIISQSARESSTTVPFKLEMGEIGRLTTNISASLWLTCLNKHLRPYALRPDDEVLMAGDAVTTALNGIFFRSALWLDDDARSEAATIINRTKLEPELWHHDRPSSWSTAQQLQAFIGALPYKVPTAFQGWTQVAKFHREHFPGWPLYHSLLHLHSQFSLLVDYDYWKNSLYVVPAILSEPVFYPNGHEPINHGGLGFMLARQLVRALDVKVIKPGAREQSSGCNT
ncbi:hypothetical protein HPB48_010631 [Haemaphysalis longicornis]|uniref:Uncharacterized protein n=1 Tax=Haemaphysalis longicornis TaxID=44386 RepID=A0A9J6G1D2_HAELO|nr:hypothetical protein HPB48_010631 [Haemaphysalis longicornis]